MKSNSTVFSNSTHDPVAVNNLVLFGLLVLNSLRLNVALLGAAGNVVNIKTFVAMGIFDGVNICFTWLAASDLMYLNFSFVDSFASIFQMTESLSDYSIWFPVEPGAVHLYVINLANGLYSSSVMTTDLVTVIRCLSVVKPLQFRNMPSWRKLLTALTVMTVSSNVSVLALFIYMAIIPKFDVNPNATRLVLWLSPKRVEVRSYIFGVRDAFLPFSSQIVLIVCSIFMADALYKAFKFRQKHTISPNASTASTISLNASSTSVISPNASSVTAISLGKAGRRRRTSKNDLWSPSTLGGQELQVIRQMLLISTVAFLCNVPKVTLSVCDIVIPDFTTSPAYHTIYNVTLSVRELFQALNASLHFLIYWSSNTKFRRRCGIAS